MNSGFRANNDSGDLVSKLWNDLSIYLNIDEMEAFLATNPSLDELVRKVEDCKNAKGRNPYGLPKTQLRKRWVTDRLVFTKHGSYKEYKEAK